MENNLTIIDPKFKEWISALSKRYRQSQLKAAVKVNAEMLKFYWELGKDIVEMQAEDKWPNGFWNQLSAELQSNLPNASGLSVTNLKYSKYFYNLYNNLIINSPQLVDDLLFPQEIREKIRTNIFSIPWGHHRYIMDKFKNDTSRAIFYVNKCVEEGWSRAVLLNFIDTNLYEREGKAITNFSKTLPSEISDLANELTKDPYNFAFTGITGRYNERLLKDKLLNNITNFLLELGSGFAFLGKEYRLEIGDTENFIDLLFYNLNLRCYVVVEVKVDKLTFADAGQLGGYVAACNHILRKEGLDNPTIGLLICKEKNNMIAKYAIEASNQPLGISKYDLSKLYPTNIEGTIPSIEDIEKAINK